MTTHTIDPNIARQTLPAPSLEQLKNAILNPAARRAVIKVMAYPCMANGDKLVLSWSGLDADGLAYKHEVIRFVSEESVGKDVVFIVNAVRIAALDGGTLAIHYTLNSAHLPEPVYSRYLELSVGDVRSELLPAIANDAVGGTLDPERVMDGALVTIKPYARMAAGDRVLLAWAGATPEASFSDVLTVEHFAVDGELSFWISPEFIAPNLGSTITIGYSVKREGQPQRYSEPAPLLIGSLERGPLAAPEVLEAADGWLDLQDAIDGVTIVIDDAQAEDGELVYLKCDAVNTSHRDDREISRESAGQPLVFIVPYRFWRAVQDAEVRVSYSVERLDDVSQQSEVTVVQVQSEG